jgi:hypothetical protein
MDTLDETVEPEGQGRGTRPAHEIRLGRVKAVLWPNRSESGTTWFSVEIGRLYKDGDSWKSSPRFSRDDLPLVARVAEKAFDWIYAQGSPGE